MILATDVHYEGNTATAAGVLFRDWDASEPECTVLAHLPEVADYVPGQFYQRELPCLMTLLEKVEEPLSCIVVDGFVYLDGYQQAGLGKHLYDALDGEVTVIGVAKSAFRDIPAETAILRGNSQNPLYITAAGMSLEQAKSKIQSMHGAFRLPTLLKQVDRLCRQGG